MCYDQRSWSSKGRRFKMRDLTKAFEIDVAYLKTKRFANRTYTAATCLGGNQFGFRHFNTLSTTKTIKRKPNNNNSLE